MTAAPVPLDYFVEGMDCASCVQKVERLVGTLPGTAEVSTSFSRQTLRLQLDETRTPRAALEGHLRSLGYAPALLGAPESPESAEGAHAHGHPHEAPAGGRPWYAGGPGRLVLGAGALLALAWVLGFVVPPLASAAYTAAALLGCWPLARQAWASARLGEVFSIQLLVGAAAIGAVLIGQAAEGAVVVFLFALGELLEGVAASRARAGIRSLAALTPDTALLLEGGAGGTVREVPARLLRAGQRVQVNPGARVPADGQIVAGESSLDQSALTGESLPVLRGPGDPVYAGSINHGAVLTLTVQGSAADTTLARTLRLVQQAESRRAPTARFIERFSRVYTPGVVLVAAAVALIPPLLMGGSWHEWLYRSLSLLLIGCPCALVLSVPAAVTSALAAGARRGLLIKGGEVLEALGRVRVVAFDKTGTLTRGTPQVREVMGLDGLDAAEVLRLAAAVESGSSHPLARAVLAEAGSRGLGSGGLSLPAASEARALPGRAVSALVEGRPLMVASPRHARELASLPPDLEARLAQLEGNGQTAVLLLEGTVPLGLIALRDTVRPDARPALARLHGLGLRTLMLSGDNGRAAQAVAAELGLAQGEVRAELLPEGKLALVERLRAGGRVMMVGDGINDAPALAAADVGVAMGGGSDVALETAHAALLRGEVMGVAEMIELSRAAAFNVRQNIAFALGLKLVFLVSTLLGHTSLWMAILADTGATAIVTANALRLLGWKPKLSRTPAPRPGIAAAQP